MTNKDKDIQRRRVQDRGKRVHGTGCFLPSRRHVAGDVIRVVPTGSGLVGCSIVDHHHHHHRRRRRRRRHVVRYRPLEARPLSLPDRGLVPLSGPG